MQYYTLLYLLTNYYNTTKTLWTQLLQCCLWNNNKKVYHIPDKLKFFSDSSPLFLLVVISILGQYRMRGAHAG